MPMKRPNQKEKDSIALTDDEFWTVFVGDLEQATGYVVIQSPYIWDKRLSFVEAKFIDAIKRGVVICIFFETPEGWYRSNGLSEKQLADLRDFQRRCKILVEAGVHVNTKAAVHQKLALIDGKVHYEGSLNMLSHNRKAENMRRFCSTEEADAITEMHGLNKCARCNASVNKHAINSATRNRLKLIGASIKKYRMELGVSQKELAAHMNLARSHLTSLEKECNASLAILFKILEALSLDILIVPRRHALAMSSALESLLQNQIEMKPDIKLRRRYKREVYTQDAKEFKPRQIFDMPAPQIGAEQLINNTQTIKPQLQPADFQTADPQTADPQPADPQPADFQTADPQTADPQPAAPLKNIAR